MIPQENENKTWLEVIFEPLDQGQAIAGRSTGVRNGRPESFTGQREVFEGHGAAGGENAPKDTKDAVALPGMALQRDEDSNEDVGPTCHGLKQCQITTFVFAQNKFYNDSAGLIPA